MSQTQLAPQRDKASVVKPMLLSHGTLMCKDLAKSRRFSPYPNGLTPDIAARAVADRLARTWNQPVVVEPRPGANGFIAIGAAKKAAPDGHELLLAGQAHLSINPNIFPKAPYDAEQDFVPLSQIYRTPFFIAVAAAGPYKSVADLIAAAKTSQKKLSYSSPYVGSPPRLGAALFALIGAEMVSPATR